MDELEGFAAGIEWIIGAISGALVIALATIKRFFPNAWDWLFVPRGNQKIDAIKQALDQLREVTDGHINTLSADNHALTGKVDTVLKNQGDLMRDFGAYKAGTDATIRGLEARVGNLERGRQ